jgi:hypothetical protein
VGEKLQLRVLGSPLHESDIGVLKLPDWVCAVTVKAADVPGETVMALGAAFRLALAVGGGGGGSVAATQVEL